MSGAEPDDPPPEMLGAEYVLGTLDDAALEAARARLAQDPAFAAEIRFWEARLLPLATMVEPVQPPEAVWDRITQTLGSTQRVALRSANDNRVRAWRAVALASIAMAASLAAFIVLRPPQPPTFALLLPTGVTAPVLVGFGETSGRMDLRFNAPFSLPADRDLQLWSLPAGATKPTSFGLLPPGGRQLPPGLALGTKLLVSSEPKGGSPTGLPTGPVVYGGVVSRFRR